MHDTDSEDDIEDMNDLDGMPVYAYACLCIYVQINQIKMYSQPSNCDNKWGTPEENQKLSLSLSL